MTEEKIFTPENLSKILYGTGTKTCSTFEKLHDLCFDKAGNKTNYLNSLIKNNLPNKVFNILYKKVRKGPSTSLDDISLQQNINRIEEGEMEEDINDPSTSLSNEEEHTSSGSQDKSSKKQKNSPQQSNSSSGKNKSRRSR